jgi:hypothetical protein
VTVQEGDIVRLAPGEFRVLRVQDAPYPYQGEMVTLKSVCLNAAAVITGPLILEEEVTV